MTAASSGFAGAAAAIHLGSPQRATRTRTKKLGIGIRSAI
jgi:hypothetical protein